MKQYHDLLQDILDNGIDNMDRTGTGTRSVFGRQIRFDLSEGFPAVTTKKLAWRSVVSELLWFLEGSEDERRLAELRYGKDREALKDKTTIWTDNANKQGVALGYRNNDINKLLGPVYGAQWRNWELWSYGLDGTIDQIANLIDGLKHDPHGRRHMVSAWNVADLDTMALPPCHYAFQMYVRNNKLSCLWNQRSVDSFLGLPFNIASYALLTHIIARECGFKVGELIGSLGDTHIYSNHFEQVREMLSREPRPTPALLIDDDFDLSALLRDGAKLDDVSKFPLFGYDPHPEIKGVMAV